MTDQLLKERDRGHQARQILDNPVFISAWARFEDNLMSVMSSPTSTDDVVLEARRGLIVLRRLKKEIENEFQTGQMANLQLVK